jgi:hypothetical protein
VELHSLSSYKYVTIPRVHEVKWHAIHVTQEPRVVACVVTSFMCCTFQSMVVSLNPLGHICPKPPPMREGSDVHTHVHACHGATKDVVMLIWGPQLELHEVHLVGLQLWTYGDRYMGQEIA